MTDVTQFIADIRTGLERLRSERAALPVQLEAAVRGSDGPEIRRIKAREVELQDEIMDYVSDAQKRLIEFSPRARRPLQENYRRAEAAAIRAKEALEAVRRENVERENAAIAQLNEADQAAATAYSDHRFAADYLAELENELRTEFSTFAAAV